MMTTEGEALEFLKKNSVEVLLDNYILGVSPTHFPSEIIVCLFL